MTINDIARLAGVSASTVSKIVNGKDENINARTRERVLRIVKEYNYSPYSAVKSAHEARTFLLGVLTGNSFRELRMLSGIMAAAQAQNYQIVAAGGREERDRLKALASLTGRRADGLICGPEYLEQEECRRELEKSGIPWVCSKGSEAGLDWERMGYLLTEQLVRQEHTRLGCCTDGSSGGDAFLEGYRRCLYEHGLGCEEEFCFLETRMEEWAADGRITGMVCFSRAGALKVYEALKRKKQRIPGDFSVAVLQDSGELEQYPRFTGLEVSFEEFGAHLARYLIGRAEKKEPAPGRFSQCRSVFEGETEAPPRELADGRILVIGSIHMDIVMEVPHLPQGGETVHVERMRMIPGGKGLNQAAGIAKLGKPAALLGRVGNDYEGSQVMELLSGLRIERSSVERTERADTGRAYIHIQKDGESSITVYSGANALLEPADVEAARELFARAPFCLIQTEIPMETVRAAVRVAREEGAKVILKPSAAGSIEPEILAGTEIFVPNQRELDLLCPEGSSVEEKAEDFLRRGPAAVIATLGGRGCYLCTKRVKRFFPAAPFPAVDATGGADAFIAALAVYLSEGAAVEEAVVYATAAAGLNVSRQGVIPALADRAAVENYVRAGKNAGEG